MDDMKYDENAFLRELGKINIDGYIGLKYCGDLDFYQQVLKISFESYEERYSELTSYYDEKDYHGYTILVHSIKSGAANIGALEIRNMAKELEDAGKKADYKYILDNHASFMKCYRQTMEGLARLLAVDGGGEELNQIHMEEYEPSKDEWSGRIGELEYCLGELEIDDAIDLVDRMAAYELAPDIRELLGAIKRQLGHFDVEGAKKNVLLLKADDCT